MRSLLPLMVLSLLVARLDTAGAAQPPTSEGFRSVARTVGPAVVVIRASQEQKLAHRSMPRGIPMLPPGFGDFFQMPPGQEPAKKGLGSGFLIDKKGLVVTNNHVVDGADKIEVVLATDDDEQEGETFPATVVGRDPRTDLAVLKIKASRELPIVSLGDSDKAEVGDWVVAIGSPFALSHSVSAGIVSAKKRSSSAVMGSEYGFDLLQTDAAINPGNSGGPLCTLDGKVIGVNTAIYSRDGGYMGIGFAIPSSLVRDITDQLIKDGKVTRGYLGVVIQKPTPERLKEAGVKQAVVVHEVQPSSPAQAVGIKAGDLILEAAGKPVGTPTALQRIVRTVKPGEKLPLKVLSYQSGKRSEVSPTILAMPNEGIAKHDVDNSDASGPWGLVLAPTPSGELAVDGVEPGSPAEQAGLQPGDVLVQVNRTKPQTVEAVKKALGGKAHAEIIYRRDGRERFAGMDRKG